MLRIIAGKFRSRKLHQPPLSLTRSTKDRVREAIFSSLSTTIINAHVLDLYAGSGAYGFEALSRGAAVAYFNDNHQDAFNVIHQNVKDLNIEHTVITQLDYQTCLYNLSKQGLTFDIIFLDPPYQSNFLTISIEIIVSERLLSKSGIIVIESEQESSLLPEDKFLIKTYNYGRTFVHIGRYRL